MFPGSMVTVDRRGLGKHRDTDLESKGSHVGYLCHLRRVGIPKWCLLDTL